jgi:cell wall assembly regulator SMI1
MDSTEALLPKLLELKATLRPPPSAAAVAEAEETLRCRFPGGIRHFYECCDGVENPTAEWIWDFFSLQNMAERTAERRKHQSLLIHGGETLSYQSLVCFCDVLIDAPTYLFCADEASGNYGRFYADQGYEGWLVATSYEEFVEVFLLQHNQGLLNV